MELNKIYQGDCLELMKQIPDGSIDCIITDPPYGIDYQSAWRTDKTQWKPKIANDKSPFVDWTDDAYRILKNDGALFCFTRWDTENTFRDALSRSGFICKSQVIWDKQIHGMGNLTGDFAPQHENIVFAVSGRFIFKNNRPKSIIRSQRVSPQKLVHPNEKPIDLIKYLIKAATIEDNIVLDCFIGSGTTAVACLETNRNFIGMELEPKYVDIANKRIEEFKQQLVLV